jgi:hypothetical protein
LKIIKEFFVKRLSVYLFLGVFSAVILTGCPLVGNHFAETRTKLFKTNIIGISGEPSGEPYIEIQYSVADDSNPGYNKTETIMVSPPYIFQNDSVYIKYDYEEWKSSDGDGFRVELRHNYEEGGAEYLRIINHSADKQVEFFFAGAQDLPETSAEFWKSDSLEFPYSIPSVRYEKAPIYYLLYPERKPQYDIENFHFVGNTCGNLEVTEPWTVAEITALFRAEYSRSPTIRLIVDLDWGADWRMIDLIKGNGKDDYCKSKDFYGVIEPGDQFVGNEKIWLLATPWMFRGDY